MSSASSPEPAEGRGLAHRLAGAGQQVIIGSRNAARAASTAAAIDGDVRGSDNATTAWESDVLIVAAAWEDMPSC
ncbi:NAD(P)-binding domain-containing protein [Streptomyces sp. ME18-1-4]|uniref:NAD(P)-binding domain-containing protein n=1 Tax=Streptomyces sp. ME18-1-4 TaxID=3028685 RepID=UPI0039F6ADD9